MYPDIALGSSSACDAKKGRTPYDLSPIALAKGEASLRSFSEGGPVKSPLIKAQRNK